MTPEQFAEEMQHLSDAYGDDKESVHQYMDDLMAEMLIELGYEKGVEVFQRQDKWYC
jgi:hypothetical protein